MRYQWLEALKSKTLFNVSTLFVMMVSLFPIIMGKSFSNDLIYSIISISVVIVIHFSWGELFEDYYYNGILEQLCIRSELSLFRIIFIRILNHWVIYGITLSCCASIVSLMLGYDEFDSLYILFSIMVLTFLLVFIGGLGSVLMLSRKGISMLVPIVVIPFAIPILILSEMIMLGPDFYLKAGLLFLLLLSNIPILVAATVKSIRLVVAFG